MIPRRYGPLLSGLMLSGLMSLLISGLSTFRAVGPAPGSAGLWFGAWWAAWVVGLPRRAAGRSARPKARRAADGSSVIHRHGGAHCRPTSRAIISPALRACSFFMRRAR